MNQAVKLRVLPDDEEETALEQTLRTWNAAASWLSTQMHTARVFRKIDARHRFYTEPRQRFGLGAQAANRVIGKVAGAYAALHANITAGNYGPPRSKRRRHVEESSIVFRPLGAQPFDLRCLSWRFPDELGSAAMVSIWTVAGRMKNVVVIGDPKQLMLLRTRAIAETDLIHRDGNWFLHATVEAPEAPVACPVSGFIGVDMGIVNIATTNTGGRAFPRSLESLPQAAGAVAETVAGHENQIGAAAAEEAAPKGIALRRRCQSPDLQTHRGRG